MNCRETIINKHCRFFLQMDRNQLDEEHALLKRLSEEKAGFYKRHDADFKRLKMLTSKLPHYKKINFKGKMPAHWKGRDFDIGILREVVLEHDQFEFRDYRMFLNNFHRVFKKGWFDQTERLTEQELEFLWLLIHGRMGEENRKNPYVAAYLDIIHEQHQWIGLIDQQIGCLKRLQDELRKRSSAQAKELLEDNRKTLSYLEKEKKFSSTLELDSHLVSRREFFKISTKWAMGFAGLMISLNSGTAIIRFLMQDRNDPVSGEMQDFLEHYKGLMHGEQIVRDFAIPDLMTLKGTGLVSRLSVHRKELYRRFSMLRPNDNHKKTILTTSPSPEIKGFAQKSFDRRFIERMISANGLGKAFIHFDYLSVCAVLAFLNRHLEYVSDYKTKTKDGKMIKGKNRDKYDVPYDHRDYWKFPEQTMFDGYGDCEDFSILACSFLRSLGSPKTGLCILSNSDSAHAILAIEIDVGFMGPFFTHHLFFNKSGEMKLPYIYCRKEIKFPRVYKKRCMACEWESNDKFYLLLEPQSYHARASSIDIDHYDDKTIYMGKEVIDLHKDYKRVMKMKITEQEMRQYMPYWVLKMDEFK